MLGTNDVQSESLDGSFALGSGLPLARIIGTAIAAAALITAVWYAAQVVVLDHSASAALTASVASARAPLRPDASVQITARGAGVDLEGAQLFRADVLSETNGSRSAEQPVPIRLQPVGDDGTYQVLAANGGDVLDTDGAYRLVVRAAAPRPALPMPRTSVIDQQYHFTTVASPHAQVPAAALQPRWAEPVSFTWSEPMQDVSASVEPAAPIRTWVDGSDPTRTWVQVGGDGGAGLADGQTYDIRVTEAHASDGLSLKQPVSFKMAVPQRPAFVDVPSGPVTLRYGETFTLKSASELANVDVTTTGGARVDVGQKQIQLALPDYQQGAEFDMTVASATSTQGAPLAAPLTLHLVTPPAFAAPSFDPDDGDVGIQPSAHPSVTFAEPVADQAAATRALSIDPPVAGNWKWTAPDTAVFVPDKRLPLLTNVTLTVHGGPAGPRTASGGYLDGDQSVTFRTTDYKRMEVSLSRQTMTLYENDVAVRTIYVATGVAAAPTPTGTFYVQMKAPQMRFQGFNPDGSHYDIPDVHWVMPFWGDYTIHGAYWRPRFGVPGSDGCVSMTDADAKSVYDWADVGTPIVIHS